jgi:2,3-bisphosphoglycerate-independent phosphoglycerate mutase
MDFDVRTCPPHDHLGKAVEELMPQGTGTDFMRGLMSRSVSLFQNHEVNKARRCLGKNPASSIWLWGQGRQAVLEGFQRRFGFSGAAITAVDLARGLAKLIGFDVIEVPGATGFFDTNYAGKAAAAIQALRDHDLVFIHIEAPDEASHAGNAEIKVKSLERIDRIVVGPVLDALKGYEHWRILVMPDHPTSVRTRGHSDQPVPFAMAGSGIAAREKKPFTESNAAASGLCIDKGHELMEYFFKS